MSSRRPKEWERTDRTVPSTRCSFASSERVPTKASSLLLSGELFGHLGVELQTALQVHPLVVHVLAVGVGEVLVADRS